MKAIITVGVSASGKSTYAEEMAKNPDWMEINRDTIRKQLWAKMHPGTPFVWFKWKWKHESSVTAVQSEMVGVAVKNKKNIIMSDTNLNEKVRTNLFIVLTELGYNVELKLFEVSFEEALRRDTTRENGVGLSVIAKQVEQWNEQFGDHVVRAKLKFNPEKTNAVLVDVDGTLAHMKGRSPFDWDRVDEDAPDNEVIDIVNSLCDSGYYVIILSGRDGSCYDKTKTWLQANNVRFHDLIMRTADDMRGDDIVKKEILVDKILPYFNVKMVIDDRPRVCNMWRSLGIKVIQCGNPYIFF